MIKFQSTHPRGVRLDVRRIVLTLRKISIHAPAWGATKSWEMMEVPDDISIHAPAWGATYRDFLLATYPDISIHAPAWGATWKCFMGTAAKMGFQSTHPRGVRHIQTGRGLLQGIISIHAPAWGATTRSIFPASRRRYFNPRTRVGCDDFTWITAVVNVYFNPRTRVGCDDTGRSHHPPQRISIHAPAWGATICAGRASRAAANFNPRTRVGCDVIGYQLVMWIIISIHAPAWGATQSEDTLPSLAAISIHAPAWGATKFFPALEL